MIETCTPKPHGAIVTRMIFKPSQDDVKFENFFSKILNVLAQKFLADRLAVSGNGSNGIDQNWNFYGAGMSHLNHRCINTNTEAWPFVHRQKILGSLRRTERDV
ncbi:hypothetical protein Tco_0662920 [Tanacetum coccineum]